VLSGGMREVKQRYPRNHVVIDFEGDSSFLQHPTVASYKAYGGHVEIRLHEEADAQQLLHAACARATIFKFDLMEPSLEEIFIQTVGRQAHA
jgi:ABC-2 type transport system ATP-binding protein